RAPEIGGATAGAADDPLRRARERLQARAENAALPEDAERAGGSLDVELIARAAIEGPPPVRPDLGVDAERAEQAERPPSDSRARDVEVEGHLPRTHVPPARGVKERRQLGLPVAFALGRDRCQLVANIVRERHVPAPA